MHGKFIMDFNKCGFEKIIKFDRKWNVKLYLKGLGN